jgi:hypothetical protein
MSPDGRARTENPEGGPESRLWAAVVERAHGCANGSTDQELLTICSTQPPLSDDQVFVDLLQLQFGSGPNHVVAGSDENDF